MPKVNAERMYSIRDCRERFFPSRSDTWVRGAIKRGWFGDCFRDGGGWLIPESGITAYLARHRVSVGEPRPARLATRNLIQFQQK